MLRFRVRNADYMRLPSPRALPFTAADELLAIERVDVLRSNGFELLIDEDAPPHERVKLTAHPVSKNTNFDISGRSAHALSFFRG